MKFLIVFLLPELPVFAAINETTDHYDRFHLSASTQTQIENDTAIATLYSRKQGSDTSTAGIPGQRANQRGYQAGLAA